MSLVVQVRHGMRWEECPQVAGWDWQLNLKSCGHRAIRVAILWHLRFVKNVWEEDDRLALPHCCFPSRLPSATSIDPTIMGVGGISRCANVRMRHQSPLLAASQLQRHGRNAVRIRVGENSAVPSVEPKLRRLVSFTEICRSSNKVRRLPCSLHGCTNLRRRLMASVLHMPDIRSRRVCKVHWVVLVRSSLWHRRLMSVLLKPCLASK
mmetsp:Transcript_9129/g.21932  ORF Transcript_9129/g.21932 Transcript_9129/m.21932 type:complete len:208 (-) Transcript_9129:375-998(-)